MVERRHRVHLTEQYNILSVCSSFWWRWLRRMLSESVLSDQVRNFTVPTPTTIDSVSVASAYRDVQCDLSDTKWAVFKYNDNNITLATSGETFDDFRDQFVDTERAYGYLRLQTGDEMSKRTKFVLVTWVGPRVGVMDRAKVTSDKSLVKQLITNYATEFQLESKIDMEEELFKAELFKIGGTHYGTGVLKN